MSSTCIARPLIYVDVSLHSIKNRKVTVPLSLLNAASASDAQGRRILCRIACLPIKGRRGRHRFVLLYPVGDCDIEKLPSSPLLCVAHMSLSNTSPSHYYPQFKAELTMKYFHSLGLLISNQLQTR